MRKENAHELPAVLVSAEHKALTQDHFDQLNLPLNSYKKNYEEFIDTASHDLHAPLRKLSLLIELLTTKYNDVAQNDSQAQEWLTRINGCLSGMRSLIDDLTQLAGITADSIKNEPCNINGIVNEILHDLEPEIKEKKVDITLPHLPIVQGDAIQYKLLFKNIIENAIRFSKKNISPKIDIASQKINDDEKKTLDLQPTKQYYKVEISDNGIGFRQEYAEKILQPFTRLNGKSAFPGNGFGLAICKRVVDNHGGVLYAESLENTGTRFTLIIPETLN